MVRGILLAALTCLTVACGSDGGPVIQEYSGSLLQDAWCGVSPTPCCTNCAGSPALLLAITGVATDPAGDAVLTLQIAGDLDDDSDETLTAVVDGISLGTLFNGNEADDSFDLSPDSPTDCTLTSTSATIPLADLRTIVADGQIIISLTPRQDINDIEDVGCNAPTDETVTVSIRYLANQ